MEADAIREYIAVQEENFSGGCVVQAEKNIAIQRRKSHRVRGQRGEDNDAGYAAWKLSLEGDFPTIPLPTETTRGL